MHRGAILGACIGLATVVPAQAQGITEAFGHDVAVVSRPGSGMSVLKVDGREMLSEPIITLEGVAVVKGVPVMIGYAGAGGNACEGSPFVLSLPQGGTPKVDGPPDACGAKAKVVRDGIVVTAAAGLNEDGRTWSWDPGRGLVPGPPLKRALLAGSGWDRLRERKVDHPARLMDYADTAKQVQALAGDKVGEVKAILDGPFSGGVDGTTYKAEGCQAHNCLETGMLVLADIPGRRVYLAWRDASSPAVHVAPAAATWTARGKAELKAWSERQAEMRRQALKP